ncbi:MAG: DUF5053 domain-containing protein [Prevotella sp.]|jgi:hypothetical protein|nr:DUF5053 domain-containing protein [Prevotella sp.]
MNQIEKYLAEWHTLETEEDYANFDKKIKAEQAARSEEEKEEISRQFEEGMHRAIGEAKELIDFLKIRRQLEPVLPYVSLSMIAKEYFGKSRNWLYQKLNGNMVNGKPAYFTDDEKLKLKYAIDDITKKFQSVSASLS